MKKKGLLPFLISILFSYFVIVCNIELQAETIVATGEVGYQLNINNFNTYREATSNGVKVASNSNSLSNKTAITSLIQLLLLSEVEAPNIAFITSSTFNGDLGGTTGADQICQDQAEAAGLPANTYVAWLSTPSINAIDRLGDARGWVRVDGKPFADTLADISAGRMFHPLRVDEFGNFDNTSPGYVWTGNINWAGSGESCISWTSSDQGSGEHGTSDGMGYVFKDFGSLSCRGLARLYCFGVDNNARVTVVPAVGRIAFITRGSWMSGGGVAAADQLCQDEAIQAGLNGTFKALLATDGASAASRFNSDGSPWVRPDGVVIAPTRGELFSSDYIDSAIYQSADGLGYFANYGIWTGAIDPTTAGTSDTTCKNWTDSSDGNTAISGRSGFTAQWKFFAFDSDFQCSAAWKHLYCLQD